jgi:thioredoxin reductase
MPKQMEKEDFEELIRNYVKGAKNLQEGGFDGIEVYSAHGYLLSRFLSPHTNKRTDEYGGSLENRLRLHHEIITAIRNQVGRDFAIGLRINGDDFTPGGLAINELREAAKVLAATGELCYVSVSGGTYYCMQMVVPDFNFPLGIYVPLSAAIREVVDIPVICVGRIIDPVHAEKILQDGHADMIAMTRALVCEPERAKKAREGVLEDIRQCVGCNQGCAARASLSFRISCIQNPTVGKEKEWGIGTLKATSKRKEVMVVGAGPGGMEAARIAAMRGHKVTLYEKDNELGGQFNILYKTIKSRKETEGVIRYLSGQIKKLGIKINLGTEVGAELVYREQPEVVIIATGSTPTRTGFSPAKPDVDKLPGADQGNVATYWEILKGEIDAGENVVVIDERSDDRCTGTAEFLAEKGKKIKIITRLPYVGMSLTAGSFDPDYQRLFTKGVEFCPFTAVKEIEGSIVVVVYNIYSKSKGLKE